jgi:hypothetical protein
MYSGYRVKYGLSVGIQSVPKVETVTLTFTATY